MASPTPFIDVNTVLYGFLERIQTILESQFVGFYLYGSLAIGDFDPQHSDIDFIVVTQSELPNVLIEELRAMHVDFDQSGSNWVKRVEAAYIPLISLKSPTLDTIRFPQIERDQDLSLAPVEAGWPFQRHTLRELGIVVSGPDPKTLTDPVTFDEMKQAAVTILETWDAQARQDPEWITWVEKRSCQSFVVLTTCRLLFSLATGLVASKPAATRWALTTLATGHGSLIQRALSGQYEVDKISQTELQDTLEFIDQALEQAQKEKL